MRDEAYRKRLEADLKHWREEGWVTQNGASAILASLPQHRAAFGFAAIMGTLGALLLGAGVIAFVAANWEDMPRIARFGLLLAGMAVAYIAAAAFARPGLRVFSEAALLVAGMIFAAAIALVGQSYHLSGDFTGAVLLFEVGILAAAILTNSPTLTILAVVGAGYWAWLAVFEQGQVLHTGSLVALLAAAVLAIRLDLAHVRVVAMLGLGYWLVLNILGLADLLDWFVASGMVVVAIAALLFWAIGSALAARAAWPRVAAFGRTMLWPGVAGMLVAVGILQGSVFWDSGIADDPLWLELSAGGLIGVLVLGALALSGKGISLIDLVGAVAIGIAAIAFARWATDDTMLPRLVGGVIVLGAALFVVNLGQASPQHMGKKLGLAAFGIELLYLYVVTIGTVIDTAIAFLLGGVLFIVLAYALYKVDRRLVAAATAETAS